MRHTTAARRGGAAPRRGPAPLVATWAVLVLVALSATMPSTAAERQAPSTGAVGSAASAASTVRMPGLKTDDTSPPTQIVEPAWWTPMATVGRDCGFSVPLTGGEALWIFCDSTDGDTNFEGVTYFVNNTAALAFPAQPTVMREPWDPATGAPYQFIDPSTASYHPCGPGERHVIWPIAATRSASPPGLDRVVVYYENICQHVATLANRATATGVAEWLHDPSRSEADKLSGPIRAHIINPDVLERPDGITPWGVGAVDGRDGYVYLNRCHGGGCSAARVPVGSVGSRSAYSFWTGGGWTSHAPAQVGQVEFLGVGLLTATHLQWVEPLGAFILTAWNPGNGREVVAYASSRPYGPWTPPIVIDMAGCDLTPRGGPGCYHAAPHAHLSSPGRLAVSVHDAYQPRGGRETTGGLLAYVPVNTRPAAGAIESVVVEVGGGVDGAGLPTGGRVSVSGWAEDPNRGGAGFAVDVEVDGTHVGSTLAWLPRPDIAAAFTGWTGDAGYQATFAADLLGDVEVCLRATPRGQGGSVSLACRDVWVPDPASPFTDMIRTDLFFGDVVWADERGITGGWGDGTFRPNAPVRREAMAAFLYRLAGSPPFAPPVSSPFVDVPTDHLFFGPITWLASTGVTTGYGDGTFRPGAVVGRAEMAAFLHRLAGSPPFAPPVSSPFVDVPTDHLFFGPITWLASTGVTTGYGDRTYRPSATVLRGAMAAFLHRYDAADLPTPSGD